MKNKPKQEVNPRKNNLNMKPRKSTPERSVSSNSKTCGTYQQSPYKLTVKLIW